jgi:Protein tyrosine and serine/threonine kinase
LALAGDADASVLGWMTAKLDGTSGVGLPAREADLLLDFAMRGCEQDLDTGSLLHMAICAIKWGAVSPPKLSRKVPRMIAEMIQCGLDVRHMDPPLSFAELSTIYPPASLSRSDLSVEAAVTALLDYAAGSGCLDLSYGLSPNDFLSSSKSLHSIDFLASLTTVVVDGSQAAEAIRVLVGAARSLKIFRVRRLDDETISNFYQLLAMPSLDQLDLRSNFRPSLSGLLPPHHSDDQEVTTTLKVLNLSLAQYEALPVELGFLPSSVFVVLRGSSVPRDIPWDITRKILRCQRSQASIPQPGVRVTLLGERGSGRSTLVSRLTGSSAPTSEPAELWHTVPEDAHPAFRAGRNAQQTMSVDEGVGGFIRMGLGAIGALPATRDKEEVNLQIWNYQGETAYGIVHRLFLSKGSLPVIVISLEEVRRKGIQALGDPTGDAQSRGTAEWWLRSAARRGASTVMVVGTHLDVVGRGEECHTLRVWIRNWNANALSRPERGMVSIRGPLFVGQSSQSEDDNSPIDDDESLEDHDERLKDELVRWAATDTVYPVQLPQQLQCVADAIKHMREMDETIVSMPDIVRTARTLGSRQGDLDDSVVIATLKVLEPTGQALALYGRKYVVLKPGAFAVHCVGDPIEQFAARNSGASSRETRETVDFSCVSDGFVELKRGHLQMLWPNLHSWAPDDPIRLAKCIVKELEQLDICHLVSDGVGRKVFFPALLTKADAEKVAAIEASIRDDFGNTCFSSELLLSPEGFFFPTAQHVFAAVLVRILRQGGATGIRLVGTKFLTARNLFVVEPTVDSLELAESNTGHRSMRRAIQSDATVSNKANRGRGATIQRASSADEIGRKRQKKRSDVHGADGAIEPQRSRAKQPNAPDHDARTLRRDSHETVRRTHCPARCLVELVEVRGRVAIRLVSFADAEDSARLLYAVDEPTTRVGGLESVFRSIVSILRNALLAEYGSTRNLGLEVSLLSLSGVVSGVVSFPSLEKSQKMRSARDDANQLHSCKDVFKPKPQRKEKWERSRVVRSAGSNRQLGSSASGSDLIGSGGSTSQAPSSEGSGPAAKSDREGVAVKQSKEAVFLDGVDIDGGLIGSGVHGGVFRGVYQGGGVAVKIVRVTGATDASSVFAEEAAVMKQLSHPNIITFFGLAKVDIPDGSSVKVDAIVMEYAHLGSALELISREDISETERIWLLHDVAAGMAHLSSKHLVHGDLAARSTCLFAFGCPVLTLLRCFDSEWTRNKS